MARIDDRDRVTIKMKALHALEPRVPHVANDKFEAYALELKRAYRQIVLLKATLILIVLGVLCVILTTK